MPEVPSGTATFLFSDVEGSTRLLKELRERYGEILAEHQRILREAFAAHDGEEVDTQGDSFFVAFHRAQDAVLAAADAQRALAAHDWPENVELRVRIGIHTGQVALSGDRYVGVAVHRAARICAAGHGGQVLVSQTTKGLLDDEEVDLPGLEFRDLGDQRLKDLDRTIRLFQLAGKDLLDEFPPLTTGAAAPFAGREEELGEAGLAALERRRFSRRKAAIAAVVLLLTVPPLAFVLAGRSGGGDPAVVVRPNSVAVIDPAKNEVVGNVAVGRDPAQLAYADGDVWVANSRDNTLSKISAKTLEAEPPVGVAASEITDLAVGYEAVWLAAGRDGTVLRFDPANDVFHSIPVPRLKDGTGVDPYIHAVAVGLGGVWALDESQLAVFRVSPQTAKVDLTIPNAVGADVNSYPGITCDPLRLATGLERLWTIDPVSPSLVAIDLTARELGSPIRLPASNANPTDPSCLDPASFAVGEQAVWLTSRQKEQLWRVDPTLASVSHAIPVGRGALGVAVDADGVWVANSFDGTVTRVDPQTKEVVKTIQLGHLPSWVAVGGGRVWVSVQP